MGSIETFARVEMRGTDDAAVARATPTADPVAVPLRMAPSLEPWRRVTASRLDAREVPFLRRLAYALPHTTLANASLAMTSHGAFLRVHSGIEAVPLGTFYTEVHPGLYVATGHRVTPAVAPEVLARALDVPQGSVVFLGSDGRAIAVEEGAFVPLEGALVDAPPWEPALAEAIEASLEEAALELRVTPVGLLPLRGVDPPLD